MTMTPPEASCLLQAPTRRVLLAGASGLVGGFLLRGLLADPSVREVEVLARRPLSIRHEKLQLQVVDFKKLPKLPPVDEVYLALGTTIKVAGSREAFAAVDLEANLAVAKAARQAGAKRMGLVSALGADPRSAVFYNRIKGELEQALRSLDTETLVIARPSLLLGDRDALGQPSRPAERFSQVLMGFLRWLLPKKLRPISAEAVAQALLNQVPKVEGTAILAQLSSQSWLKLNKTSSRSDFLDRLIDRD